MMRKYILAAFIGFLAILSGCSSTLNIGEDSFSCPGTPETGFKCMGVRDLYKATEGPSASFGKEAKAKKAKEEAEGKIDREAQMEDTSRNGGFDPTPWVDKPQPIRSQAKVMRIWVAPYEDEVGDLNAPGMVFTEVEGRRWNVGEGLVKRPARISSLNSPMEGGSAGGSPFTVTNTSGNSVGMLKNVTPVDKGGKPAPGQQNQQQQQNPRQNRNTAGGQPQVPPIVNTQ